MTKKEKTLSVIISIYLCLLLAIILALFLCIILHVSGTEIFIVAFVVFAIVGYLVIAGVRRNVYVYKCKHCEEERKMTYGESLFARRLGNSRKLKCKKCNKKDYMERLKDGNNN